MSGGSARDRFVLLSRSWCVSSPASATRIFRRDLGCCTERPSLVRVVPVRPSDEIAAMPLVRTPQNPGPVDRPHLAATSSSTTAEQFAALHDCAGGRPRSPAGVAGQSSRSRLRTGERVRSEVHPSGGASNCPRGGKPLIRRHRSSPLSQAPDPPSASSDTPFAADVCRPSPYSHRERGITCQSTLNHTI